MGRAPFQGAIMSTKKVDTGERVRDSKTGRFVKVKHTRKKSDKATYTVPPTDTDSTGPRREKRKK